MAVSVSVLVVDVVLGFVVAVDLPFVVSPVVVSPVLVVLPIVVVPVAVVPVSVVMTPAVLRKPITYWSADDSAASSQV